MADEDIIRRRLMIDGDGTGDARMMTVFLKSFVKWCSSDDSAQDAQSQFDRLLTQLSVIDHSFLKWKNIEEMNNEEVKHYDDLRSLTNGSVDAAHTTIEETKAELDAARQVRRNRLEYDALARLIKEHPPRSHTASKLAALTQQLHALKSKRDELEERVGLRRKQLHTLVTALHQLQTTFDDEQLDEDPQILGEVIDLTKPGGQTVSIDLTAMDTS